METSRVGAVCSNSGGGGGGPGGGSGCDPGHRSSHKNMNGVVHCQAPLANQRLQESHAALELAYAPAAACVLPLLCSHSRAHLVLCSDLHGQMGGPAARGATHDPTTPTARVERETKEGSEPTNCVLIGTGSPLSGSQGGTKGAACGTAFQPLPVLRQSTLLAGRHCFTTFNS